MGEFYPPPPVTVAIEDGKPVLRGDMSPIETSRALAAYAEARANGASPERAAEVAAARVNIGRQPN